MKKGLTATQLKLIAVIAMICEHVAWAAFDTVTPLVHLLHFVGNISLPLFCFFIVEGYRKTSNIYLYISRLFLLWILSIYPFHVFYGGFYRGKQNFIFDLLLGLFTLIILDSTHIHRFSKVMLCSGLLLISACYCVYPFVSILFIVSYYRSKSPEMIKNNTLKITVCLIFILPLYQHICCNMAGSEYEVAWHEQLYLLGILFVIPLINGYNGKLGINKAIRYIFYVFYPLQFIVTKVIINITPEEFFMSYLYLHILTIIFALLLAYMTLRAKLSYAQISNITLVLFGLFFMIGYYIELTASTVEVMSAASKIEFTGVAGMILGFTWFMNEFCNNRFGNLIYVLEGVFTGFLLYAVFTQETNHLFYLSLGIRDYKIHSVIVERPGIAYICFYVYLAIVMITTFIMCYQKMKVSSGVDRVRAIFLLNAEIFSAFILIIRLMGVSEEYDLIPFAIFLFLLFFTLALIVDDYFGNIQTNEERDPLTGLSNRGYFINRVAHKMARRTKGTLLMMDMDNFKQINDNYGHGTGDRVLVAFGEAIEKVMSSGSYMSRLGGDEFCVYVYDTIEEEKLQVLVTKVIDTFHELLHTENLKVAPSVSIGIASYDGKEDKTFEELYENADKALYVAKNSGKSQYKFYA